MSLKYKLLLTILSLSSWVMHDLDGNLYSFDINYKETHMQGCV
jgi:hypothetical protein